MIRRFAPLAALALLGGCAAAPRPVASVPKARAPIEAALQRHIDVLASDAFGGRQPGTEGEELTLKYLAREWQAIGLESGTNDPANPWFAPVEIARTVPATGSARFYRDGRPVTVPDGAVAVSASGTRGLVERAPAVLVGPHGAPLDGPQIAGRVAFMLWDRGRGPEQRAALHAAGAAAVIALVANDAEVAATAAERRRGSFRLASREPGNAIDGALSRAGFAALVGEARAAQLNTAAAAADFRPTPLDLAVSIEATAVPGTIRSYNLIARLPGKRPAAGAVLLLAHWDHFGQCAPASASHRICNGAVDNASGLAVLTEVARRLARGPKLDRDVYVVATTAEEWGLLGAQAFADDPPVPLDTIVAAFNLDTVAVAPAGNPVAIIGKGLTGLDPGILAVIRALGRREGDEALAREYLRRQDGWALLQREVPAVSVTSAFGLAGPLEAYMAQHYHQPSDQPAGIELGGAADDVVLTEALARHFGSERSWPGRIGKSPSAP